MHIRLNVIDISDDNDINLQPIFFLNIGLFGYKRNINELSCMHFFNVQVPLLHDLIWMT